MKKKKRPSPAHTIQKLRREIRQLRGVVIEEEMMIRQLKAELFKVEARSLKFKSILIMKMGQAITNIEDCR